MKYYTSRELSEKLSINLAKWKRWAREFLPPDPLGGLRSGYARQYTREEAFIVFLGGYAVGDLNIPVPATKKLLQDLSLWFEKNDFLKTANGENDTVHVLEHVLIFYRNGFKNGLMYHIRHVVALGEVEKKGILLTEMNYFDEKIQSETPQIDEHAQTSTRSLYLTRLYDDMVGRLEPQSG
jgi:hypothetical protein